MCLQENKITQNKNDMQDIRTVLFQSSSHKMKDIPKSSWPVSCLVLSVIPCIFEFLLFIMNKH